MNLNIKIIHLKIMKSMLPYRTLLIIKVLLKKVGFTLVELMIALVLGFWSSQQLHYRFFIPVRLIVDVKKRAHNFKTTLFLASLKYNSI